MTFPVVKYTTRVSILCGLLIWLALCGVCMAQQSVVVNVAPGRAIHPVFEKVAQIQRAKTSDHFSLGIGAIFSYLNQSRDRTKTQLLQFLSLAGQYDVPVVVQLDGEQWWGARPDLWNWWDSAQPGYDPKNRNNVEWSAWGPEHAIKIAWRNWGRQIRVLPPPNFMSPAYRQACHVEMRVLIPLILRWWDQLPKEKKHLLIGIKLGWESAIGVNSFYYPNGNDLLNQSAKDDPQTGLKADQIPARGVQAIGYAAVTSAKLAQSGILQEVHLTEIVSRHLKDLCALAAELNVPRDQLFTHIAGWKEQERLYDAALNEYACPGWSFYKYARDPAKDLGVQRVLAKSDAPHWAAVEWLFQGRHDTQDWSNALKNTLADPKCRYVCIYNWSSIKDNKAAIDGIGALMNANN